MGERYVNIKSGVGSELLTATMRVWAATMVYQSSMDHSEKLHVVYEGETVQKTIQADNSRYYLIGGWDYDRRETKWRRPADRMGSRDLDKDA